jgi:Tol biopolymer transport system component
LLEGNLNSETAFFRSSIASFLLSQNGRKVVLTTEPLTEKDKDIKPALWTMNSDGTRQKKYELDFNGKIDWKVLAWPDAAELVYLQYPGRRTYRVVGEIVQFNLKTGAQEMVVEKLPKLDKILVSPGQDKVVYCSKDEGEDVEILNILDLKTFEKTQLHKEDFIKMGEHCWSKSGEKYAFFIGNNLCVYHLNTKQIKKVMEFDTKNTTVFAFQFDWVNKDKDLVVKVPSRPQGYLMIYGEDLNLKKRIDIPSSIVCRGIVGSGKYVLARGYKLPRKNYWERGLWRLDLDEEDWKKIY